MHFILKKKKKSCGIAKISSTKANEYKGTPSGEFHSLAE